MLFFRKHNLHKLLIYYIMNYYNYNNVKFAIKINYRSMFTNIFINTIYKLL